MCRCDATKTLKHIDKMLSIIKVIHEEKSGLAIHVSQQQSHSNGIDGGKAAFMNFGNGRGSREPAPYNSPHRCGRRGCLDRRVPGCDTARMFTCLKAHKNGVSIRVKVLPGSSRNGIFADAADVLTVRLTAPPVEGKANKELLRLLAKALRVAPSQLVILSGEKVRNKVVLARGVSLDEACELIERFGQ